MTLPPSIAYSTCFNGLTQLQLLTLAHDEVFAMMTLDPKGRPSYLKPIRQTYGLVLANLAKYPDQDRASALSNLRRTSSALQGD